MSDTYDANWVPSGRDFLDATPSAPDDRGFSADSATFATGPLRVDGNNITTRASCGGGVDVSEPVPAPAPAE